MEGRRNDRLMNRQQRDAVDKLTGDRKAGSLLESIKREIERKPNWEWRAGWYDGQHYFDITVPDVKTWAHAARSEGVAAIQAVAELDALGVLDG